MKAGTPKASDILLSDRTEAFDQYQAIFGDESWNIFDFGGHRQYHLLLHILTQSQCLFVVVANPYGNEGHIHERIHRL